MIVRNLPTIIFVLILCAYHGSTYITWIEARIPLKGNQALPGTPWPVPQEWNQHENVFIADPQAFHFESNVRDCDILEKAYDRYREIMFHGRNYTLDESLKRDRDIFNKCTVHVNQNPPDCGYPKYGVNENYEIMIRPEGCKISSDSVWGAIYGMETLSQLLYPSYSNNYLLINQTYIHDWPEYKYRGLLLDTARHFIPVEILLANLDAMAYNKFNVFHWHLVDDQSFPYESKRFPELTRRGAYSSKHVYTQKDVKLVIDYARMRGIRVLPEIDSPGHTKVFERAFPNILTPCYGEGPDKPYTPRYPEHSDADNLHPLRNETYSVMLELFKELKEVFPDEYIHLGMDEVYYACWKSNPEILSFMQANGWTQMNQVEQYYVRRTLENVKNINYKYMIWQDPVDNGVRLANDSLVEVWKDTRLDPTMKSWQEYTRPIAQQGYEIVLSACWYLNYINYPYPGRDWELYYLCDPRSFTNVKQEKDLVVGGEACLWSEFADGTNILSRIWPRASAVAERLWTNPNVNDVDSARFRLDQHRCRMLERGIPAAPILNGFCGDYEWANKEVSVKPGERIALGQ